MITPPSLLLAALFARDYRRNGVNALVLVAVPGTFVLVAAGTLADSAQLLGGNPAAVTTVTAGWAAGFVSAIGMYFLIAGNRAADRRLIVSGMPRRTLTAARSATGLIVVAVACTAALLALAARTGIEDPARAIAGTVMFALVYAAVGSLVGVLVRDPVNGTVVILFVWIIDVFFGPALTGSSRAGTRVLPTHYLSEWMSGEPSGHSGVASDLAWAMLWTVAALAASAWLVSASARRPPGRPRHGHPSPDAGRTADVVPHAATRRPPVRAGHPLVRAVGSGVRDWSRVRVLWLLLVLVPAVFVLLSDAITPPGRMAVAARDAGRAVTVYADPANLHAGTMAASGIAALAALAGSFVVLNSRGADRRLVRAGMAPNTVVVGRLAVIVLAATAATVASLAITRVVFEPEHWGGYAVASALIALTYALVGMLIAPVVGRIGAVLLAFLIPFLDLGLSQSPMLRAEPSAWAQLLPGYGGMRMLVDAAVTPSFDQWGALAAAGAWLIAVGAAAVVVAAAPLGRPPRDDSPARVPAAP